MKKLNELIEERKLQYETTLSMNMDTSKLADYLATMSDEERNEYSHFLEEEKKTASEKLNNSSQIEEDIKKEIIFNAIKFIDSMKYVSEYSLDLQELINRAPNRFWFSSNDLSKTEKLILMGYVLGQSTFGFSVEDYKECGGYSSPDFLRNLVNKINSEYNVIIPLPDEFLSINKQSGKGK